MPYDDDAYPWEAAYRALVDTLREEVAYLRGLLDDGDAAAAAEPLRRERAAALEWAIDVSDQYRRWEW